MCLDDECPLSWNCWRFNAPPKPLNQSYFSPTRFDDEECEYYLPQDNEEAIKHTDNK